MKKKICLLILLFSLAFAHAFQQDNILPEPLKVLQVFSVDLKFDKAFNLVKAQLEEKENLIKADEDKWSATLTDSLTLSLMALRPGQITVPKIQIITYDELGADTLYTEAFDILVMAVTDSTSQLTDIKTIQGAKAPITLESQYGWFYTLLKYLSILIIIFLVVYLIYKYYPLIKAKLYKNSIAEDSILHLPWEYALKELNIIKKRMLLVGGKEYDFSIEMSLLIRRFLEKYYEFPAAERTTLEIKAAIKSINVKEQERIINILVMLDEIKYTKGKLIREFSPEEVYDWFEKYLKTIKVEEEKKLKEMEAKK